MPFQVTIELDIPEPLSSQKITINTFAAKESTVKEVSVHCKCKDKRTWCITRHCAYVKAEVKYDIACYSDKNTQGDLTCLNVSSTAT